MAKQTPKTDQEVIILNAIVRKFEEVDHLLSRLMHIKGNETRKRVSRYILDRFSGLVSWMQEN